MRRSTATGATTSSPTSSRRRTSARPGPLSRRACPTAGPSTCVIEDLKNKNLLFAGTQFAVYFSINGGKSWSSLLLNAPTMAFHDLIIHPRDNDLIAATHSRGIWILDDISALQQAPDTRPRRDAFLFAAQPAGHALAAHPAGRLQPRQPLFPGREPADRGPDPLLRQGQARRAGDDRDLGRDRTRRRRPTTIENPKPGINRLVWDFRFDPPADMIPGTINAMKSQIQTIAGRGELTDEQKAAVQDALKQLDAVGTNYRRAPGDPAGRHADARRGRRLGGGGGGGQRGGMGANVARAGRLRRQDDGRRQDDDRQGHGPPDPDARRELNGLVRRPSLRKTGHFLISELHRGGRGIGADSVSRARREHQVGNTRNRRRLGTRKVPR